MKNFSKLLLALSVSALISCGDEKKESEESFTIGDNNTTETTTTTSNRSADTEEGTDVNDSASDNNEVVEVSISGNDQMQFDKNEIRVQAGQTVRLTLTHTGEMEENVMGHNFVLLEQGTDINEFGQAAASAADNEYIPANSNQVIAHTELIGGGETTTIEFEVPESGSYDFICSFPGHYAVMKGKFIVE